MDKAINKKRTIVCAKESVKIDGPFTCLGCSENVILRKGKIRQHHFSHKSKTGCGYSNGGIGETPKHKKLKLDVLQMLLNDSDCYGCQTERDDKRNGGRLGDVSCFVKRDNLSLKLIVEIQLSPIKEEDVKKRMERYTDNGCFTLWLFDGDINIDEHNEFVNYARKYYYGLFYTIKDSMICVNGEPNKDWVKGKPIKERYVKRLGIRNIIAGFSPFINENRGNTPVWINKESGYIRETNCKGTIHPHILSQLNDGTIEKYSAHLWD